MNWLSTVVSGVISPVTKIFSKREERKKIVAVAQKKIEQANADATNSLNLSDAEWEALSVSKQDSSWKDEYITLIITLPIPMIFMGAIYFAWTDDERLLNGVNMAIASLATLGVDWGELMYAVVLAAIGLKVWRGRG